MAVLNYTTTVEPERTANEIRVLLRKWGAEEVSEAYDTQKRMIGMGFRMGGINYRIPCEYQGIQERLQEDYDIPRRYKNSDQARRVAWRMLLGWLKYQLEVSESGLFEKEAILMPYRVTTTGEIAWEVYKVRMLPGGEKEIVRS